MYNILYEVYNNLGGSLCNLSIYKWKYFAIMEIYNKNDTTL